ncbi:uncharacterized protein BJX67DRAFT_70650 [Aspergillus lucknowensis]|uniref:Mitochondrial resolvase Ydc2 n=1 Tax=Aspergillus lucknowensis TaxID=176173 RepID=A0ABR4LX20_9EURO
MRLTLPLLKLQTTNLSAPLSSLSWLSTLKAKQLQHIAQKTGLPSSGTKPVLIHGLENGLAPYLSEHLGKKKNVNEKEKDEENGMSILSIDMGIRNLAFAHLRCPPSLHGGFLALPSPGGKLQRETPRRDNDEDRLVLNAWRRVSLPLSRPFSREEFEAYLDGSFQFSHVNTQGHSRPQFSSLESELNLTAASVSSSKKKKAGEKERERESFSLAIYAEHAHSIMSTLLARYNPTHILIERQRFRSGGGAAVQEWSLRVGVFEGMIWAVLHSLRQLHQQIDLKNGGGEQWPKVVSIEPGRIGRYWAPLSVSASTSGPPDASSAITRKSRTKQVTTSSREGKKLKIDSVGSWLENASLLVGRDGAEPWADAYLSKWKRGKSARKGSKRGVIETKSGGSADIGKLDDLADCLVQGVTWLEWEGMKVRVARDGIHAAGLDLS